MTNKIEIRECESIDELTACVDLQRQVFSLPEVELSPVRHLVVTKNAGGFTLGAFLQDELVGFVLSVPAFLRGEKAFYSHMTAVRADAQGGGVGAKLKWSQRARALQAGVHFVKWTFEPWKARNAFFNLEKLGAIVTEYQPNFYGVDYASAGPKIGLASDRLFAEWHLDDDRVERLSLRESEWPYQIADREIVVPYDWISLLASDAVRALDIQHQLRVEFEKAFADGLVGKRFVRDGDNSRFLLYKRDVVSE